MLSHGKHEEEQEIRLMSLEFEPWEKQEIPLILFQSYN